ncbi:transmembrane transport protein [Hymenobacter roseosalivarius DSM 11622]|uniref:Transmembrane transport protein n=1 Tax=Hymenobacter roseosalivarius DSM 11622 TaxID=645990 RepID=A0A1W1VY85_9BACT|nr:NRAMP family divalent metal transporter [Hymenobacter roseosalivarius]SMB98296.1 transmembrane transport protein [Hymenobacter roseosalivarius DSM 11622]
MKQPNHRSVLLGAAFLMATSAVGPGFLTQTTVFTQTLGASFGFVILASILIDLGVQLTIWRVIAVSEMRAQDIANTVLPGLGTFISILIVLGGLAFNIGNVGGAGLGLQVLFGIPVEVGAALAAALTIAIFLVKEAGKAMDHFAQIMGLLMLLIIVYVAFTSAPPVGEALVRTVAPTKIDVMAIVTLVGGTVGGYITFAGGHRLLDAGIKGRAALPQVMSSAVSGITVASIVRIMLFLAALGVVSQGLPLAAENPPASVFRLAAGEFGYKLFGVVMFAAAVTSIIGSAYTSVSFIKSWHPGIRRHENRVVIGFILVSTLIFVTIGKPVSLLILAGALNGFILPVTLSTMLVAAYRQKVVGDYRHPLWLAVVGVVVVVVMAWLSGQVFVQQIGGLFS